MMVKSGKVVEAWRKAIASEYSEEVEGIRGAALPDGKP